MDPRFRKYLAVFVGCTLAGLTLVLALNLLVDPLGAYRFASLSALEPYRAQNTTRAAKAELAARGGFNTLVVGSSRLRAGIPVHAPAFGAASVCNLGLGGTTFTEIAEVLNFALRHNPVKRVLLGADFHNFSAGRIIDPTFEVSRFNPRLNKLEYHGRNLLGADAADEARSMLRKYLSGEPVPPAHHGFVPKTIPKSASQRTLFARQIRASLTNPGGEGTFRRSPERLELFRSIVRRCRRENLELIVFIPPVHALQLEAIHAAGVWEEFERWKRDLTAIVSEEGASQSVALWDFTGFRGPMAEAIPIDGDRTTRMKWYLEVSHFTPELGERVVRRMMSTPEPGNDDSFGFRLTSSNIEEHLGRLRSERENYVRANPEEIAWVSEIASQAKKKGHATAGEF